MPATERIVVDAHPEVKRKLIELSEVTGKPMKRILVDFIEAEYKRFKEKKDA